MSSTHLLYHERVVVSRGLCSYARPYLGLYPLLGPISVPVLRLVLGVGDLYNTVHTQGYPLDTSSGQEETRCSYLR